MLIMNIPFFRESEKKPIHLIMSVSSGGKSTYIEKKTDFSKKRIPIYLANELDKGGVDLSQKLSKECIIHYNLFRPFGNNVNNIQRPFKTDQLLVSLLDKYAERLQVTMLIAPKSVVAKRMLQRDTGEAFLRNHAEKTYPKYELFELLCSIDISDFYRKWYELLEQYHISVRTRDSSNLSYKALGSKNEISSIVNSSVYPVYSDDEIESIIQEGRFEYQKIAITESVATKGQDRSLTFNLIANHVSFYKKSVLDIGSAYGHFCFSAEEKGANRVLGTELKSHRFVGANIIKQFKASSCEFISSDVFSKPLGREFDIVLLLNVIHHLDNPIHALHVAADLCNEVLVIEFPSINDEKYKQTFVLEVEMGSEQPLIGVSLLDEQDQTFVFNKEAIRRILMSHHKKYFSEVSFMQSPIAEDRQIAICRK